MAESAAPDIRVQTVHTFNEPDEVAVKGRSSPGLSLSNKFMRSLSGIPQDGRRGTSSTAGATDPITQNIMDRRSTELSSSQTTARQRPPQLSTTSLDAPDTPRSTSHSRRSIDRRADDGLPDGAREKKAKVSFLSRLRTGAKKRDSVDLSSPIVDDATDLAGLRSEGTDAAVFSQPMGYVPKFPEPPKYIKVRTRGKTEREFDRLFLAQELRGRTGVEIAQAGGHRINVDAKMKHDNASWAMEFSKDGHYLAAGGQGHVVRVWAVIASEADRREEERADEGSDATGSAGPGVKLSAPIFKSRPVQEYEGHTASILAVSWSKNNFLLSSSMDKTVRLWHVSRAECLCVFKHPDYVPAVQFHPQDDRFFLAGSLDSKLRLWSIPDKSVAYSTVVKDLITAIAFTPDGKTVMAGTLSGLCIFYDTEKLREQTKMHVRSAHGKNARGSKITGIQAITLPPNDAKGAVKLLITSNDSRIRIYNMRDKSLELKLKGNENTTSQIKATFSDDARHIICGSEDKKCYIWNMCRPDKDREKHPMETFDAHNEVVTSAIMAPAATKQLLQASGDPVFEICNPPPVQLLSRDESRSVRSLKSGPSELDAELGKTEEAPRSPDSPIASRKGGEQQPPSSSFKARSAHPGGYIIITADTEGRVKCFRSDCAYKNRIKNNENWDGASTFSKKVLHRSSSIATRASRNSMSLRDSIINMGQPSERILSWRQSIDRSSMASNATALQPLELGRSSSLRMGRNNRSMSPNKSISALNFNKGRRISTHANFPGRPEVSHPLSTSVSNTPALSSAAVSQQSLRSGMSNVETAEETNGTTRTLSSTDFGALGIKGSSIRRRRTDTSDATSENYTGEEDIGEVDEGGKDDDDDDDENNEDGAERCRGCGSDSFKATRQGKGRSTRLQCARCGLLAD